jgi:competence protein ComFC
MALSLHRFIDNIFSFLFPKPELVRKIEKLTAIDFEIKALLAPVVELSLPFTCISLFSFKDELVRNAIYEIKYRKNLKISDLMSEVMQNMLPLELEDEFLYTNFNNPIIIPIPAHWRKLKKKCYNQTELLLNFMQEKPYPSLNALEKIRETEEQIDKNRKERLENLKNCFAVKPEMIDKIRERNIILFDDVVTTGGTLIEAYKVLKKAKVRRVIGFTLAH